MEEKNLIQVKFTSFIKLYCTIFISMGIAMGILMFIMSLGGANVTALVGTMELTGIKAGIAALFIGPLVAGLVGIIFGILSFLPFKLLLNMMKGIKIKVKFE